MSPFEYLNSEFLYWPIIGEDFDFWPVTDDESRPYELWSHAERLLDHSSRREYRADAIANLKRAVYLRISKLNVLYRFKQVPRLNPTQHTMEIMAEVGLIRPVLLRNIVDLRNQIEHEDRIPPDENRCKEWLEFVWYFLRSTDNLLSGGCKALEFRHNDDQVPYWLVFSNGPGMYSSPLFHGWVSPEMLSEKPQKDWLNVEIAKVELEEELHLGSGMPGSKSRVFIEGKVIGPRNVLVDLARKYFHARHKWNTYRPSPT